jgi:hypothetical protein
MSDYSEHLKGFINSIANGDNVSAENDFNNAMAIKIASSIEDKRVEVAQTFIKTSEPSESEENV